MSGHDSYDSFMAQAADAEGYGDESAAAHWRACAETAFEQQAATIPARFRHATSDRKLERGLYLHGPVGVGKTYQAAALALDAIRSGKECRWVTVPAWLAATRASFNGGPAPVTVDELARVDVLVLDDIGSEKPSAWAIEQLFAVINGLYEAERLLICTSNLRLHQLDTRLGERITSRLAEVCDVMELRGDDRRLQAAAARLAGDA